MDVSQAIAGPAKTSVAALIRQRAGTLLARTWVRALFLSLIGFAVHFPGLQGQLIWDDQYLARDNPFIKSPLLILETFRHSLFLDSFSAHYRPVQNVSYIFDYLIWNTDPYGFHLSSILWHVGSGVLLFLLLEKLLQRLTDNGGGSSMRASALSGAAFFAALLWVVHPVHSAAVDYISGRADSLAFFFSCGAWLLYLKGREASRSSGRSLSYSLAGLSLLLGLCSRESACLWVVIFLAHLFAFEKKLPLRGKLAAVIACLLVVGAYAGLRQLPDGRPPKNTETPWSVPVRATLMLRALGDYGRLVLWPSNLHMERTVFDPDSLRSSADWRKGVAVEYLSIGGLLLATALGFGAFRKGRARPIRAFGAGWFLLAYLPVSNLVDLNATVAEHWLYLPSVGLLLFLAGCVLEFPPKALKFATSLAAIAMLCLSARSFVRSTDWADGETFYRRTLEAGGATVRVALNLGQVYSSKGEYAKAEALFRRVLKISPNYALARTNLGDALYHQGKTQEANEIFARANKAASDARKDYPRTWIAALSLAQIRYKELDAAAAISLLDKARADYPGIWELISFEAEVLRKTEGAAAALPIVQEFAKTHWWHGGSFMALGCLYGELGLAPEAEAALRHASWLDVHDAEALNLIASMKVRQSRFQEAYDAQRRAVSRQPDQPRQYLLLSDILEKMGRGDEARAALTQVHLLQAVAKSQTAAVPN